MAAGRHETATSPPETKTARATLKEIGHSLLIYPRAYTRVLTKALTDLYDKIKKGSPIDYLDHTFIFDKINTILRLGEIRETEKKYSQNALRASLVHTIHKRHRGEHRRFAGHIPGGGSPVYSCTAALLSARLALRRVCLSYKEPFQHNVIFYTIY